MSASRRRFNVGFRLGGYAPAMEAKRCVLVLTDLVDSTRITSELGDKRAAALWADHDDRIRRLIAAHGGLEIDKSDGFLLVFESVADAVAFQVAYHAALASITPPLRARVGLHVGDVVLRKLPAEQVERGAKRVEVDGIAKPLAARLMALAAGGQSLATPDVASLSPGARPLGHYRLKGIADPIEVWALAGGSVERPPDGDKAHRVVLSAGNWVAVGEIGHGLGAESDAFVGRLDETARLHRLVGSGARLLTLVGPGGVGKTRLARHFALEQLGDFSGGTYFVDLVSAFDEAGLVRAVAKELALQLGADPVRQLGFAVSARGRMLLVLDNFEQIISLATHVAAWLAAAPELTVLATSRQRLSIAGEHVVDVDPLPLPPPADAPSVALFVRRAQQLRPDFAVDGATLPVLIDIVRRLDGLPLAIELAAARLRVLGITQLRDRLQKSLGVLKEDARSDRQRTLQATIAWSWQLLDPKSQVAFREASVFRGTFDLEAAEAVLTGGDDDALDRIHDLVDKSLVRVEDAGGGRSHYRLLDSIRVFGEVKLAECAEEKAVRDRHARWCFDVAARAIADPLGRGRLAEILPNLRAALFHAGADPVLAREGMPLVYQVREWTIPEGLELMALARPFLGGAELGRLTHFEAQLQFFAGDSPAALHLEERACEILRAAGELVGVAEALLARGKLLWWSADPGCEAAYDDAVRAAEVSGDESMIVRARAFRTLSWVHHGQYTDAEAPLRARVAYAERADPVDLATALNGLGVVLQFSGRRREAHEAFERGLEAARRAGLQNQELNLLGNLGDNLVFLDPARGVTALEEAVRIGQRRGDAREVQIYSSVLASAYLIAGRVDEFLTLPLPPPPDRRFRAMQDLRIGIREALRDEHSRARETIEGAARLLAELGETEVHWIQEHAIGLAFVALAEARAGTRTFDDATVEARTHAAREISEPARQTIEREIARSRG